ARGWILNYGNYTADWSVQLDVNLPNTSFTTGQGIQVGLSTSVKGGDGSTRMAVFLGAESAGRFIESGLYVNSVRIDSQSINTTSTSAAVRLSWRAATLSLVAEYDENGAIGGYHWTTLVSRNISSGSFNWNMTSASNFVISVFGNSQSITVR